MHTHSHTHTEQDEFLKTSMTFVNTQRSDFIVYGFTDFSKSDVWGEGGVGGEELQSEF